MSAAEEMKFTDFVAETEICGNMDQLSSGSSDRIISISSQEGIEKKNARIRFTANLRVIDQFHLEGATFRIHCKRSDGKDHLFILTNGLGEELNMAISTYLGRHGEGSRHDDDPFNITGVNFRNRKRKF